MADLTCKHCGEPIICGERGYWTHTHGKSRCNPDVSGLIYGYNADPEGADCRMPCLGFVGGGDPDVH